eukprot:612307-Rhodomonas_salina.2
MEVASCKVSCKAEKSIGELKQKGIGRVEPNQGEEHDEEIKDFYHDSVSRKGRELFLRYQCCKATRERGREEDGGHFARGHQGPQGLLWNGKEVPLRETALG